MTIQIEEKELHPKGSSNQLPLGVAATCPPLLQAPPKPSNNMSLTPVWEDTPWPSAGKTSGNLFKDRNWLLPKGYLAIEGKKGDTTTPSLKEEPKAEDYSSSTKEEKCGWGPFCKTQNRDGEDQQQRPIPKPLVRRPDSLSQTRQQWEAEMERLNFKYNLDCFLDSELDSESEGRRTVSV